MKMAKKENLPHIGKLARSPYLAMMAEGHRRLAKAGFESLDASYSFVFQFIGQGSRITDIAKKANTQKQNIKYLIDQLEKIGYVIGEDDKSDKRARIYKLTDRGTAYRNKGLKINLEIEQEWALAIGKDKMLKIKELLFDLDKVIEEKYLMG
jgi:DNA-binding MarR family transcriptional regulator